MYIDAFGESDLGRQRSENEDHLLVECDETSEVGLFVVADGVGGHRHGQIASDVVVTSVGRQFEEMQEEFASYDVSSDRDLRDQLLHLLETMLHEINRKIYELAQGDPRLQGMCTTAVVAIIADRGAFIGHVGDSRAYLLRGRNIYQLTEDHTFAQQLHKDGLLSADEMDSFIHRNVLTRSLGSSPRIDVDTLFVELEPGDRLMLCTDGLTDFVEEREILEIGGRAEKPRGLVAALIDRANEQGGEDNITVVSAWLEGEEDSTETIDLERKLGLLREMFLFKDLTDQELLRVLRIVYTEHRPAGEVIIEEGTEGDEIYVVVSGKVDVTLKGEYLTSIMPGGHFGEMALIDDHYRSASVTAFTDVTLLTIRRGDFLQIVQEDHTLATKLLWSFLGNLAGRVRDLSVEVTELNKQLSQDKTVVDIPSMD